MSKPTRDLAPLPAIGLRASRSRTIIDERYAALTPFVGRVAHGIMVASMISAVLGNDLPGHGSIYLGQTLKFLAPVRIGDTIIVTVEVISLREDKHIVTLRTDCTNQEGTLVLTGEATIKYVRVLDEGS